MNSAEIFGANSRHPGELSVAGGFVHVRTPGDVAAEAVVSLSTALTGEYNAVGLARHEPRPGAVESMVAEPGYAGGPKCRRTSADVDAEYREAQAWATRGH